MTLMLREIVELIFQSAIAGDKDFGTLEISEEGSIIGCGFKKVYLRSR